MIIGIIIGVMLGFLIGLGAYFVYDEMNIFCLSYEIIEKTRGMVFVISLLIITITGGWMGVSVDNGELESKIKQYEATQEIFNYSIDNEKLGGLEKIELVKMANEANVEMADLKVSVHKWWSIAIKEETKGKIDMLELIK